ncbi:unnamed protein product [Somion occarium]|uniref:Uncharacterized protein n=1 Tax=Somion occarium TaxID=3059160 RepID=A0ABP1DJX3_9APHY
MAKGKLPVATAELIGTFLEAIFYGIYLVVFPQCIEVLLKKRKNGGWLVKCFLGVMVLSFILITMHLCVDLTRAFTAFAGNMEIPGSPEKFYANVDTKLNLIKNSSYITTTLIADAVLLFRTWVVWGRSYLIVAVPVLLWCTDIAMAAWFTWSVNEASPGASVLVSTVFARSKYFYAVTLALNVLCTVLIAFRVWSVQRTVSGSVTGRLPNVLSIVIESAAIYSVLLIILIGTSVSDSSAMFFLLNSMAPAVGSVFSYVILRSSGNASRYETTFKGTVGFSTNYGSSRNTDKTQSEGVEICLERIVHTDEENPPFDPEGDHPMMAEKRSPSSF